MTYFAHAGEHHVASGTDSSPAVLIAIGVVAAAIIAVLIYTNLKNKKTDASNPKQD